MQLPWNLRRSRGAAYFYLLPLLGALINHSAGAEPKIVAYIPNWIDVKAQAGGFDYAKLTHVNIAFENPKDDEGALGFNPLDQRLIDEAHQHGLQALISIGGGAASGDKALQTRYFRLIAPDRREAFANKLTDYVTDHGFDGLDVDIEGPSINADYGGFVHALATAMNARGKYITAALSEGYGGKNVPDSVFADFALVNIMAYDAAGPWNPKAPGQHSSLEFAKKAVAYWLGRGLPPEKAVLGVPFYGYGFGDAFRKGDYGYKKILESHPGAELLDQVGSTIWYNGIPTIKAKAALVRDQKLGGVMIWSLDYDVHDQRSLLSAIYETLHPAAP